MVQMEFLIGNLKRQSEIYKSLEPAMEIAKEGDKSADEILEILKNSGEAIEQISRLAGERMAAEERIAELLGIELFDRMSISGSVNSELLCSFDQAVSDLRDAIESVIHSHGILIDEIREKKLETGSRLRETNKGKSGVESYRKRHNDACFIDRKSK